MKPLLTNYPLTDRASVLKAILQSDEMTVIIIERLKSTSS
jgi:hypothetical protein